MSDIIKLYDPQNAKSLSAKEIEGMQNLSTEQIEELAKAYPNQARGNTYLILINTTLPSDKQVYQLSTWKNLATLRRLNQPQFSAFSFQSIFSNPLTSQTPVAGKQAAKVVDLSGTEQLPGFKPSEVTTAPAITTAGDVPLKFIPTNLVEAGTGDAKDVETATGEGTTVEYDLSNPDVVTALQEVKDQQAKLDQLVADKAHHMTIKAQQTKVDEAKELLKAFTIKADGAKADGAKADGAKADGAKADGAKADGAI